MCAIAIKKPTKNKLIAIKQILPKQIYNYLYYRAILGFYKNYKIDRTIILNNLPEKVCLGSDMRTFNKLILKNELPEFYNNFMKEMEKGFNKIVINKENIDKVYDLLHFFCLTNVEIFIK